MSARADPVLRGTCQQRSGPAVYRRGAAPSQFAPTERDTAIDELTFRGATDADRELLYRLYASTRTEELAAAPWPMEDKERFLRSQFELQDRHYRRNFPGARFDLVMRGDQVLGRLYVAEDAGALLILDLALFPEHRGQGLGTRLVRGVFQRATESASSVRVHVLPQNRARSLYTRLGFRNIGQEGLHELMEWRPHQN